MMIIHKLNSLKQCATYFTFNKSLGALRFSTYSRLFDDNLSLDEKKDILLVFDVSILYSYGSFVKEFYKLPYGLYSVFIEFRYENNYCKMSGSQFGLDYEESQDLVNLWNAVKFRVFDTLKENNILYSQIVYIQLSLKPVDTELYSNLFLPKPNTFLSRKELGDMLDATRSSPVSVNKDYLDKPSWFKK